MTPPPIETIGFLGGSNLFRSVLAHYLARRFGWSVRWSLETPTPALETVDWVFCHLPTREALPFVRSFWQARGCCQAVILLRQPVFEEALKQEGFAYLPTSVSPEELDRACQILKKEGSYLHPSLLAASPPSRVTVAERLVLQQLVLGHNPAVVARRLNLSPHTVKTHLGGIYRKLQVRDRTQAVLTAIRLGLVPPP